MGDILTVILLLKGEPSSLDSGFKILSNILKGVVVGEPSAGASGLLGGRGLLGGERDLWRLGLGGVFGPSGGRSSFSISSRTPSIASRSPALAWELHEYMRILYVYLYAYEYVHVCMHTCMYVFAVWLYMYAYICLCAYNMYVYACVRMSTCVRGCMHV